MKNRIWLPGMSARAFNRVSTGTSENRRIRRDSCFILLGLTGIALLPASGAFAAAASDVSASDTLEEVVVTAERRSQDIQKTGISVSVRSGDDLEEQGKFRVDQILQDIPGISVVGQTGGNGNVAVTPTDNPAVNITIRGVPPTPQPDLGTAASSTAYYVDGVYSGVGGDFDIDRVELLRGPQGTLYGRAATSGLVAVYTRNPTLSKSDVEASVDLGSFNLRRYEAAVNLDLSDTVAVRAAGNQFEQDGLLTAAASRQEAQEGRVKILWQPSSDVSLLVGYTNTVNYGNTGGATAYVAPDNSGVVVSGAPIYTQTAHQQQLWGELKIDAGIGNLVYSPSYHTYALSGQRAGPFAAFVNNVNVSPDTFRTHELRLTSKDDSKISWQIGAIDYRNDVSTNNSAQVLFQFGPFIRTGSLGLNVIDRNINDKGLFAEATLPFGTTWRLTTGVRHNETKMGVYSNLQENFGYLTGQVNQPVPGNEVNTVLHFTNNTYKLRLEKDLAPQNLVYAMVSTGVLPGDVQLVAQGGTTPPLVALLKQETLTSYEVGSKNRFFNDTLQLNASAFYYNYGGYHTEVQLNPANPTTFAIFSVPAEMYGIELEGSYLLTANDRFDLSFGYTYSHYTGDPTLTIGGTTVHFSDFVGNKNIQGVIPYSGSASYAHTFQLPGGSTLNVSDQFRITDKYFAFALTKTQLVDGTREVRTTGTNPVDDVNISWSSPNKHYGIAGYVDNVFNKVVRLNVAQSFDPTELAQYTPSYSRTYGVSFRYKY